MRVIVTFIVATLFAAPALAAEKIECSQIPHAQSFVDGLKPGPNTTAAQRHLDAAKSAKSDQQCVTELGKVNYYAKRSAAADKRLAKKPNAKMAKTKMMRTTPCADVVHQDRPGGSDYAGNSAGCKKTL
jgi:hypothetical protein